jgi:hypothetical protein
MFVHRKIVASEQVFVVLIQVFYKTVVACLGSYMQCGSKSLIYGIMPMNWLYLLPADAQDSAQCS